MSKGKKGIHSTFHKPTYVREGKSNRPDKWEQKKRFRKKDMDTLLEELEECKEEDEEEGES